MANRFPLVVDSSNQNIKELPDGDSLLLGDSEKLLLGDGTDLQLYHDGSNSYLANSTGALKIATESSGIAITIGHTTSETTIADNLVITGDLSVGGATLAETISDTVGAMVGSNTESGIAVTYEDSDNTLDFTLGVAQPTITSLGTLTTLTVDNVIINGSTIGHTGDTDLMTVASGILTVAGEVSMTTLDIGGTNVTSTATELNYVDGVTSAIQTQLNTKATTGKSIAMALVFG
jgi:hypothetical protein|tara:strand:+ start:167 stop:868 length:702 start_codon:yes stop_codon:yes gene_type:complete